MDILKVILIVKMEQLCVKKMHVQLERICHLTVQEITLMHG